MPAGVGFKIEAGQQVHLNLHVFNIGEAALTGTSGVEIQTISADEVVHEAETFLPGAFGFAIPQNQEYSYSSNCDIAEEQYIFALFRAACISSAGTSSPSSPSAARRRSCGTKTTSSRPRPSLRSIQSSFSPGDRITSTCSWFYPPNPDGPETVQQGDSSTEEMCFGITMRYPRLNLDLNSEPSCTDEQDFWCAKGPIRRASNMGIDRKRVAGQTGGRGGAGPPAPQEQVIAAPTLGRAWHPSCRRARRIRTKERLMARPRFSLSTVTLAGLLALGGIGACSTATAEDRDLIEGSDDGEAGEAPDDPQDDGDDAPSEDDGETTDKIRPATSTPICSPPPHIVYDGGIEAGARHRRCSEPLGGCRQHRRESEQLAEAAVAGAARRSGRDVSASRRLLGDVRMSELEACASVEERPVIEFSPILRVECISGKRSVTS